MDGLGHALEAQGLVDLAALKTTIIFFETDPRCRELLEARRVKPGAYLSGTEDAHHVKGSVFALTDANFFNLRSLLATCTSLRILFIAGGSPCVGFSQANPGGRGIDDPNSNMVWTIPVISTVARDSLPDSTAVIYLLENVDMKESRKPPLDSVMGNSGIKICASTLLSCRRPREYWTNLVTAQPKPLLVSADSVLDKGWRPLWELCSPTKPSDRFATFLRPFSPGKPREFPARYHRLPLSMYSEHGLVYRPSAPRHILEKIKDLVARCARCNTQDLKELNGRSTKLRGELCDWIHSEGGIEFLRPLNGRERDRALGFPPDASALPGEEQELSLTWGRLEASGNTFAVSVVAHIVSPLAEAILKGGCPPLRPGFPSTRTAEEALRALGAASHQPLPQTNRRH